MTIDVRDRFARSAAFWLRAYPRRWREARGAEAVDLLHDLAAPGAHGPTAGTALARMLAGARERRRGPPPLHAWLGYRVLDLRLPMRYRAWVNDDIRGAGYVLRVGAAAPLWLGVLAVQLALGDSDRGRIAFVAALTAFWTASALLTGGTRRPRAARHHLAAAPGEVVAPGTLVTGWVLHPRLRARQTWLLVAGSVAVAVAPCVVVALAAARTRAPLVACVIVLVVGAAAAQLVGKRLRRLDAPPEQPMRWLVDVRRGAVAGVGVLVLGVLGAVAYERRTTSGATFATLVAVGGAAVLPVVAVAARRAAHGPADLAACDVLRVAATGARPQVDGPVLGPVLLPGRPAESDG